MQPFANSREQPYASAGTCAGTSEPAEIACKILEHCCTGASWTGEIPGVLLEEPNTSLLFRIIVEGLSDRFEPRLCEIYTELFTKVIEKSHPELRAADLMERYRRIRVPRSFGGDPIRIRNVVVLSRVTLGADVAVSSILLGAALNKFPQATIYLAGSMKSWELFAGKPRIQPLPINYTRSGSLSQRLSVWPDLCAALALPDSIVLDPDSRLTQLGLLPVCPEENYFFFESRAYGADGMEPLSALTGRWAFETLGISGARPFIHPATSDNSAAAEVTVSLGVGENPAKRVPGPFEEKLLQYLCRNFSSVLVDLGAGEQEAERVKRAVAAGGANAKIYTGSFAGFASQIACSRLYVGYDSAGGHVAAACGVPMVCIFAGSMSERMFARWRPSGDGRIRIVRVSSPGEEIVLNETCRAIEEVSTIKLST